MPQKKARVLQEGKTRTKLSLFSFYKLLALLLVDVVCKLYNLVYIKVLTA